MQFNPNQHINMNEIIKLAGVAARESAVTGGAGAAALTLMTTIICYDHKEDLADIDGKSFGPFAGVSSKMLKSLKDEPSKSKPGKFFKKLMSPVLQAGIHYCEGMESGMRYLYSNTDILAPSRAILGVE